MFLVNLLYAVAIFLASFLLFLVEPIAAKRLLPLLGGSAAVWTTCLVFFQTALLLGYLLAHWLATRLRRRAQVLVYTGALAACLGQVTLSLHPNLQVATAHPLAGVFKFLAMLIGLPFLVLAATYPLLQAWYAPKAGAAFTNPGEPAAAPYRLYALSNFGSLLALITYPWLVEPRWSLRAQSLGWFAGFAVFTLACAGIAWLRLRPGPYQPAPSADRFSGPRSSFRDRALWIVLPACGAVLLCAMTNHVTQNIAAIPLLWIVPLTMYLLSFVVAFGRGQWLPGVLRRTVPVLNVSGARACLLGLTAVSLIAVGYLLAATSTDLPFTDMPLKIVIPFYSATLFITCLFCHAELHRLRPAAPQATSFYLMIAAGGALGSIFVGIIAPAVFNGNYELGCGLASTAILMLAVTWRCGFSWRLVGAGLSAGMAVALFFQVHHDREDAIVQLRNFYGTLRVTQELEAPEPGYTRTLFHGSIEHGTQIFTDELRATPTSYYARDSGVGLALDTCCGARPRRVGVIGLGAGTLAAYGRQGDVFRFYDINPLVERLAQAEFSYLRDSAAKIEIVTGDARLSMEAEAPQHYDVIAVDAFSSDAIPVHLLTSQALQVYRRHLAPGGIIAFHVSNQFLSLAPVVQQEAEHAGMQAVFIASGDNDDIGEYAADWVLVTDNEGFLEQQDIANEDDIPDRPGLRLWTDDYNSVLPLLRWSKAK